MPQETLTIAEYRELLSKKHHESKKTTGGVKVPRIEAPQIGEMKFMLKLAGIEFVSEFKFHGTRKWRFDLALPEHRIAIEYEGVFGKGISGHTNPAGYTKNTEKYNAAAALGWLVLRYTAKNYKSMIIDLRNMLSNNVFL